MNASSLTCYALLSAVEADLRDLIVRSSDEDQAEEVLGPGLYERAIERQAKDRGRSENRLLSALVPYIDFADAMQVAKRISDRLPDGLAQGLDALRKNFELVIPIRNRVAHSRPPEIDDLPSVVDFSQAILNVPGGHWDNLRVTRQRLAQDPHFIFSLSPDLLKDDLVQIPHNLPAPDFDETGFLGRKDQRREVFRALKGPWPVISILGDGGVGKTALALQVSYDVLADKDQSFDAVVWTTARNAALTPTEIVRIENAIQDSLGLFESAAKELGAPVDRDGATELLDYLREFRILLVLDNLETVIDDRVKNFLRQLPHGSKVLITSRIGVGTENPFKLGPLTKAEAVRLLRILVRQRGVNSLAKLPDADAERFVERMSYHPAYIKWFVAGTQAGSTPESLLSNNGLLLDYCMSNVYGYLDEDSRQILKSMQVIPGTHSLAELAYLNDYEAIRTQSALLSLTTTNFLVQVSGGSAGTSFALSDFARAYLDKTSRVSTQERNKVLGRHNRLYEIGADLQSAYHRDPYSATTIETRHAGDYSAARCLRSALENAAAGRFEDAITLCHEAADLAPGYHEPRRVEGYINELSSNLAEAYSAYDSAVELAPDNPYLHYFFGKFLTSSNFNKRQGLQELQRAARLDPSAQGVRIAIAEAQLDNSAPMDAVAICSDVLKTVPSGSDLRFNALYFLLQGCLLASRTAKQKSDSAAIAEIAEQALTSVNLVDVDDISRHHLDQLMVLESWAVDASNFGNEKFISLRCEQFSRQMLERRRQVDPSHLSRIFGSVKAVGSSGYGFVATPGRDYFLHVYELSDPNDFERLTTGSLVAFLPGSPSAGQRNPPATQASWIL